MPAVTVPFDEVPEWASSVLAGASGHLAVTSVAGTTVHAWFDGNIGDLITDIETRFEGADSYFLHGRRFVNVPWDATSAVEMLFTPNVDPAWEADENSTWTIEARLAPRAPQEDSSASDSAEPGPTVNAPTTEQIVAAAIEEYPEVYRSRIHDASTVVVPDGLDVSTIQSLLGEIWTVTTTRPNGGTYWEVTEASKQTDYWQVDIASVEGANYFSGAVLFVETADGGFERVNPEDIGATPTTSTS